MELVEEYQFLGMFSPSGEVCMVGLLYSCSSMAPSLKSVLSSTPNSVKASNIEPTEGDQSNSAVKVIQQWTERKSSNQEVFKFQDVSILLWVSLLLLSSSFNVIFIFIKPESCICSAGGGRICSHFSFRTLQRFHLFC